MSWLVEVLTGIAVGAITIVMIATVVWGLIRYFKRRSITGILRRHFRLSSLNQLSVTERRLPMQIRADLHFPDKSNLIERVFEGRSQAWILCGKRVLSPS